MKVKTEFGTYDNCLLKVNRYAGNDHVAIQLYCEEGPLATITTNIYGIERYDKNCSCVDTNNCPWAEEFIKENNLGEPVGVTLKSGWCTYPVYRFDVRKGA